jgi:hypothetical protein
VEFVNSGTRGSQTLLLSTPGCLVLPHVVFEQHASALRSAGFGRFLWHEPSAPVLGIEIKIYSIADSCFNAVPRALYCLEFSGRRPKFCHKTCSSNKSICRLRRMSREGRALWDPLLWPLGLISLRRKQSSYIGAKCKDTLASAEIQTSFNFS